MSLDKAENKIIVQQGIIFFFINFLFIRNFNPYLHKKNTWFKTRCSREYFQTGQGLLSPVEKQKEKRGNGVHLKFKPYAGIDLPFFLDIGAKAAFDIAIEMAAVT